MKTGAISVCVVLGLFPSVALSESISELFPTGFDDVFPITAQASGHGPRKVTCSAHVRNFFKLRSSAARTTAGSLMESS